MKIFTRFGAVLGALSLSLMLSGCTYSFLHIRIPDYISKGVDGLRLYSVGATGTLTGAGRVIFSRLRNTNDGLRMQYSQVAPDGRIWGPLEAAAKWSTGQLELQISLVNPGAFAGYYRFASYNEYGASRASSGQLYMAKY